MATLKAVQSGTATIAIGATSTTAAISSITTSKALLFFGFYHDEVSEGAGKGTTYGEITSATQLSFSRLEGDASYPVNIVWRVVEWTSGVSTQRGSVNNIDTTTNVTISSVNTAKSFALCNEKGGFNNGERGGEMPSCDITSSTNLALVVGQSGNWNQTVAWQVAEYDNCTIQKITKTLTTGTSASDTITSVAMSKTFLDVTNRGDNGDFYQHYYWSMRLTAATTISYSRDYDTSFTTVFITYVVGVTDTILVQRGAETVSAGTGTKNITLGTTLTDYTKTWAWLTSPDFRDRAKAKTTNETYEGRRRFAVGATSNTNLRFQRGDTNDEAEASWELIELGGGGTRHNGFLPFFSRIAGR